MKIMIDGVETEILRVDGAYYGTEIQLEDGEWILIFPSAAEAGIQARKYWEDMANDDPDEIACIIGADVLVAWALGLHAGPGSEKVKSLDEWLDLYLDRPAEEWSRQDSSTEYEIHIEPDSEAAGEIGFDGKAVGYPQ